MSDSTNLQELLTLKPLEVESITFAEYLSRLKDHPEMGMSAPSVLLRAIANLGEVDINEAPVERRPYLRMLKKMRISSFKAFDKVKGSQKAICANIDLYSGFVYEMLGLPRELYTPIFAMARVAGWSAHRIEEIVSGGRIIRPAYKNVSERSDYLPLAQRV